MLIFNKTYFTNDMTNFLKYLHILTLSVAVMIINPTDLQASTTGTASNGLGGRTGAPGDNGTCGSCHSGGSYGSVEAVISVVDMSGPVTSFVPGVLYFITIEVTNTTNLPNGYGFQATVLDSSDNFIGTFSSPSAGTAVVVASDRNYWEQTSTSVTNTFSIFWTAPEAMTTVTIYAIGIAVDFNGRKTGDNSGVGTNFAASLTLPADLIYANGFE